ncbi:hypothetical protein LTR86_006181 [Recurvomyces mirabilis]|nr:hypothetical protein LTR86_006181 [Recurvomyces mirabilis]
MAIASSDAALTAWIAIPQDCMAQHVAIMPSSQKKAFISFFAWAIEATQLLIATMGCTKLIFALESALQDGCDSLFLHVTPTLVSLVLKLLLYSSAIFAVDWLDASIASSSLKQVHLAPFVMTRAALFGPEHIWVLEPAPLPPWPTRRSKRRGRQIQTSTPTVQTAGRRVSQFESSACHGPAPRYCGLHVSFADGVPAFSTEPQLPQSPNQTKKQKTDAYDQQYDVAALEPKHPAAPFMPPNSGEGFVRSRVRSLSATAGPAASSLAGKSRTV